MATLAPSIESESSSEHSQDLAKITLTILYDDKPNATVVGMSRCSLIEAKINAFSNASDSQLLTGARMFVVDGERVTPT